mgnify:CR=1 FL=1
MDEKDFELLQALAGCKNITKAAEKLYITQSALSKRIQALEEELGARLLLRSRQGVRFTPEGETVLEYTRQAAQSLARMRARLDAQRQEVCGSLKAGVSINYAEYWLPDILAEYHRLYPKVRLQVSTGKSRELYRKMLDGTLDAAILRGDYSWDGLRIELSRERVCLICAEEQKDRPLGEFPMIGRKTDALFEGQILQWLGEQGLSAQASGISVDSVTTCVEMVRRGLGWSIVPEIALKGFEGQITPCFFGDGTPFVRKTVLLCREESMALPQVMAFVELLQEKNI